MRITLRTQMTLWAAVAAINGTALNGIAEDPTQAVVELTSGGKLTIADPTIEYQASNVMNAPRRKIPALCMHLITKDPREGKDIEVQLRDIETIEFHWRKPRTHDADYDLLLLKRDRTTIRITQTGKRQYELVELSAENATNRVLVLADVSYATSPTGAMMSGRQVASQPTFLQGFYGTPVKADFEDKSGFVTASGAYINQIRKVVFLHQDQSLAEPTVRGERKPAPQP